MRTLTAESTAKFLNQSPTSLGTFLNQLGQTVVFYEHPTLGDEAAVYACIEGVLANTGSSELDDYTTTENRILEPTEYMPVLSDGKIVCAYKLGY